MRSAEIQLEIGGWRMYFYNGKKFGDIMQEQTKQIITKDNCFEDISESNKSEDYLYTNFENFENNSSNSESIEDNGIWEPLETKLENDDKDRNYLYECPFEDENDSTLKSDEISTRIDDLTALIIKDEIFMKLDKKKDEEKNIYGNGGEHFLGEHEDANPNLHVSTIEETTLRTGIFSNLDTNPAIHQTSLTILNPDPHSHPCQKKGNIFRIVKEDNGLNSFKMNKEYKKNFKTVISLLKQWYQIRGKQSKVNSLNDKVYPNAKQSALKMGISKKTLDYYQLTIRKGIALQEKLKLEDYYNTSFGFFSNKVYSIYNSLSSEERERVDKKNKSTEVKQYLKNFILEF